MRQANGVVPHVLISILILLLGGAIVFSLETAPPVAQYQLQVAAKNTAAASNFVLTDLITARTPGPSSQLGGRSIQSSSVHVVYRSPDVLLDRQSSAGSTVTLLVIGSRRYERRGNGPWLALPPTPLGETSPGAAAAAQLLLPLRSLTGATSVEKKGPVYLFVPSNEAGLLEVFFAQQASGLSDVSYAATIKGEYIGGMRIGARSGAISFAILLHFSSVNEAPSVHAPSSAQAAS